MRDGKWDIGVHEATMAHLAQITLAPARNLSVVQESTGVPPSGGNFNCGAPRIEGGNQGRAAPSNGVPSSKLTSLVSTPTRN